MTIVPSFRFACQRCGHCCSGGQGYVWLAEGETAALAAALGTSEEAFVARHVRDALDPRTGKLRRALVEESTAGGRCSLLVGGNTCSVYAARPEHCRTFPFWPSVLATDTGFEAARATCAGIAVETGPELRARAFAALATLYGEVERELAGAVQEHARGPAGDAAPEPSAGACSADRPARGACCIEDADAWDELFVTGLEADHALDAGVADAGCVLGPARPLGCRIRSTALPAESAERLQRRLRAIERETGYPASYGRFAAMISARRNGIRSADEARTR